ncbi:MULTISPECIES: hypothetical protein [Acinetobacter]|uniref:Uncharacterized protein n=1 Tax=Acinetobacter baylyi (strain ATCC 33305 / BD413 / ADP1) TaxID=62977 RepID=Q6FAG1_ACIAD|nr:MULTISPECIES: hypothetical protein [Acinetobacter]ENV53887.1 hypothetical protein F952_01940 [Acinetobacter baylyi DSM 14961 = CIP 107474]KAF2373148.1 hypothetical protein BSL88_00470 [Acinetobacter baylyi]KAF2374437.1 hypothetical protein BSL67_07450 [Acinetobacter baylyi]KAF2377192.1 hypothetical protein BSN81_10015 [Acinetobacter baylyi]KAF2380980.1 hypothetical protein BSN83_07555 [Acinetobacter baylyi]
MSDYTIENGQYLKVTDKDTGDLIGIFEVSDGNVLSTIHTVETVSEEEYLIYVTSKETELDQIE